MKTNEHTKLQIVNHIHYLFSARPETMRTTRWNCVLRDDQLTVIRPFTKEPTDRVIVNCLLETNKLPSWFSIYHAVRKNWHVLVAANVEVLDSFNVNSPFLSTSNGHKHHRGQAWLANCGRFLSRAKYFFKKRIAQIRI